MAISNRIWHGGRTACSGGAKAAAKSAWFFCEEISTMQKRIREQKQPLGLAELIAIALGGMIGGGIFSVLGIGVATVGYWTPLAIALGGALASLAAYSYVKLALYFRDEGATYAFFKRSFPGHDFGAALVGWWVAFGYIATIALYAFTFASYAMGPITSDPWLRRFIAILVIALFAFVNIASTKGMGWIEDLLVYTKIAILLIVALVLLTRAGTNPPIKQEAVAGVSLLSIVSIAAVTFVAYEGFQLVIHAMDEMQRPEVNIGRAIYSSVGLATLVYVLISLGAVLAIPFDAIIENQEHALAAGASEVLGPIGHYLVIAGALLATMSAISGTLFGASRLLAVIAQDRYLPLALSCRREHIPVRAIALMATLASALVAIGNLRLLLEFGSITFLMVSILMALANHRHRQKTKAHPVLTLLAILGLGLSALLVLGFEARHDPWHLAYVAGLYGLLTLGAWAYARGARLASTSGRTGS